MNGRLLISIVGGAALLALAAAGGSYRQTYTNTADIKNVKERCATLPEKVAGIEKDVVHNKETLTEIKRDVKDILREMRKKQ